jgi:Ca-activated chloride channel family protein
MQRSTRPLICLVALLSLAALPALVRADGFIIVMEPRSVPTPVPGHFQFAPLSVTYHRVTVDINDMVATTTVDQEFYNPNPQRLEGTYIFPLPPGAHIDKFSMDVNGKLTDAELLDATKARGIYEEIVRKYKDPALLEYTGRDAFKARIFPIEPNSRKQVKISYTQLLTSDTGTVEYTYPLNTEKFSARPLENVSVKVNLTSKVPLKSVYCPSHNVEIKREGETKATVGYEERNVRPDTDFKLIFSRTTAAVGVDLLTYRNGPDDGYFLLLASPGMDLPAGAQVQQRDVCFVLDTSGSMAEGGGQKMEQAKKALSFCLANLNPGDRFEIVRFSTEAETLFGELKPAEKANIDKAVAYVQTLKPIGGTAIEDALKKAMSLRPAAAMLGRRNAAEPERPYVVIFLTDGQPTIGETNEDVLVGNVTKSVPEFGAHAGNTRIFSFGIGTDVNTHLLDRIAAETKAFSQYVLPQEDIEVKVSSFYTKISQPVLSNVQLAFTGADIKATQFYPATMPDLFKGEMLIAFGRYSGKGAAAVKVTGTLNGMPREFVTDVNFAEQDTSRPFIPQLWATRRVGWLLDEIRLRGESTELKDEVTRLAREHGIVTPYTSYLIVEDERSRGVPLALQTQRELADDREAAPLSAAKYGSARDEALHRSRRSGGSAVENAKDIDELKRSDNQAQARGQGQRLAKAGAGGPSGMGRSAGRRPGMAAGGLAGQPPGAGAARANPAASGAAGQADALAEAEAGGAAESRGYKDADNYAQQARVVNGRAFYQNGPTWTDATAQNRKDLKQQQVAFNSDDYFALLAKYPDAAQWLSLGNEVDVVLGDTLYQIR